MPQTINEYCFRLTRAGLRITCKTLKSALCCNVSSSPNTVKIVSCPSVVVTVLLRNGLNSESTLFLLSSLSAKPPIDGTWILIADCAYSAFFFQSPSQSPKKRVTSGVLTCLCWNNVRFALCHSARVIRRRLQYVWATDFSCNQVINWIILRL